MTILFGKELSIRFTVRVLRGHLSVYECASSLLVLRVGVGFDCISP